MRTRTLIPCLLPALLGASAPARPKLVVVISIDQCSAELIQTYGPELTGGLHDLLTTGVQFTEAYQDHGFTETGPGHSVLLSGRFPAHTGIVENSWFDRSTGKTTYCVSDPSVRALDPDTSHPSSNASFLGETLGDWLQAQVPGSRAFSISGKDRAAILMAGRHPSGVFWFVGPAGFSSSTAYLPQLPPWLARFDQGLHERFATQSWLWRKLPETPEGRVAHWTFGQTVVRNGALPRLIQGASMPLDKSFTTRFDKSPFLDAVTEEGAEALVRGEHLGHGPATDLLTVSFSATDYIGHNYGNLGTEMRDQLHRLDHTLGRFLTFLKAQDPHVWVVLSADHGGMDAVEALQAEGFPARRVDQAPFLGALNAALKAHFKVAADLLSSPPEPTMLYLDPAAVKAAGLAPEAVLEAAKSWLKARPEVADAFTATDLAAVDPAATGSPRDSRLDVLMRRSFLAGRSGDLLVAFKPFTLFGEPPKEYLAGHGSPWAYDRRVPLIFWGPWKGGLRAEPVRTVDLAPTLAEELGLKPGPVDGKVLDLGSAR
ncbi:MAG TPA: alkaline phosphatase family protein [Holophagaceae bacterium]